MELEDGTRIEASNIIRELNTVMAWLSYPGRKNNVAAADELAFSASGAVN